MKKITSIIILMLLVLLFVNISAPVAVAQGGVGSDPYTICGTVYDEDGTTVVSGATMTIENLDNGEKNTVGSDTITGSAIAVTSDANGKYSFELLNLKSGYSTGDKIFVTASKSGVEGSKSHIVASGSWGAVVDVTLGEVEDDDEDEWWDWWWGLLMLLCSWWGILFLLLIGIIFYIVSRSSKRKSDSRSKKR